ncbi:MAG: site-specific integrase [Chloroflexota bacterium]|nr:site-specific integrase [Chloroflexota bacterium]
MKGRIEKRNGPQGPAYRVRVELPPDPLTGERRRASKTFRTRKEAERALAEWVNDINRGTAVEPSRLTVGELVRRWLETVAAPRVRPTTLDGYRATVEKHIVPALGSFPAQRLSPSAVQDFYAAKLAEGLGARSVQMCHLRLSQALAQGVRWGVLHRNVCDAVDAPRVAHKPGKTWTAEETRTFLAAAEADALHPLWSVAATTGLRRGELLGVRWRDLDLDRRTLTVRQCVVLWRGAPMIQHPKSAASRRTVKLLPETAVALRSHRLRQTERRWRAGTLWHDNDLVFCTGEGKPLNPNNLLRAYKAVIGKASVPNIRFHDLRHTHATLLLRAGQPVKVVSERLGHAKTSITLDTYAHVLPDMQDGAVEKLGEILFRDSA